MFIVALILWEGQEGEARELSNKEMLFRTSGKRGTEKWVHFFSPCLKGSRDSRSHWPVHKRPVLVPVMSYRWPFRIRSNIILLCVLVQKVTVLNFCVLSHGVRCVWDQVFCSLSNAERERERERSQSTPCLESCFNSILIESFTWNGRSREMYSQHYSHLLLFGNAEQMKTTASCLIIQSAEPFVWLSAVQSGVIRSWRQAGR